MFDTGIRTDIETLDQWFDLSRLDSPASVQWKQVALGQSESRLPGPTDYYVIAVLEYPDNVEDWPSQLGLSTSQDVYLNDDLADLMPEEVLERFVQTPEGYRKFDGIAYSLDGLLRSPLTSGYVLFVGHHVILKGMTS